MIGHIPLSPTEIATGMVLGSHASGTLPASEAIGPLRALEREILPCLLRPPCLVSFSGGRDSSAVLAVAAALARREGLQPPIPVTNVFPEAPDTDEAAWQESVVRHLDLREWLRIEHTDELDLIGPYAQRVLRTHGLVWPFNTHFHLPLLDEARGGSLLTGIGGDELFGAARREHTAALLAGMVGPRPRDVLRITLALAPHAARRAVFARREPLAFPWLHPHARRAAALALADWSAEAPRDVKHRLAWLRRARYLDVVTEALELTASDGDVLLVHPLLSPCVWAEVASSAGAVGFQSRTDGMRRTFGEVLPDEICARGSKARFDQAFWTARTRAYVDVWDGSGAPDEYVNAEVLAEHWRGDAPLANSYLLLQATWLRSVQRVEQPSESVLR
jgi:Asparagine synthase